VGNTHRRQFDNRCREVEGDTVKEIII
jgi:hypothetical protein